MGRILVALATGQYADAEETARDCIRLSADLIAAEGTLNVPPGTFENLRDNMHSSLANALLMQGRLVEAEAEARVALLSRLERFGRFAPETAGDIVLLARVLFEARRSADSEKLSAAARDIYETLGYDAGSQTVVLALFWQARAQVAQGKTDAAKATYATIERAVSGNADLRRRFLESDSSYGVVLVRTGRAAEAVAIMERNLEQSRARLGERSFATAAAHGWLGFALARAGQTARAKSEFDIAMPILLSPSREAESSDSGGSDHPARPHTAGARRVLSRAAGRQRRRGGRRDLPRSPMPSAAAPWSARWRNPRPGGHRRSRARRSRPPRAGRREAGGGAPGFADEHAEQPSSEQDAGAVTALRQQIDQLRGARARVREEIERRFPSYTQLIDPRPATVEEVQKNLRPGEALIATYVGDERLFVWAVPQQGPVAFASTKIGGRDGRRMVQKARASARRRMCNRSSRCRPSISRRPTKSTPMLLQPVTSGWSGARSLMVVPHQSLGQIPFGLLVTEPATAAPTATVPFAGYQKVPFLIRKVAVTSFRRSPSLATLRSMPAGQGVAADLRGIRRSLVQRRSRRGGAGAAQRPATARRAEDGALQTRGMPIVRRSGPTIEAAGNADARPRCRGFRTQRTRSAASRWRSTPIPRRTCSWARRPARRTRPRRALANRRIIVFATHGLVPGDLGADPARPRPQQPSGGRRRRRWPADGREDSRPQARCGLGRALRLQYRGGPGRRRRGGLGPRPRLLLRRNPRAPGLELAGRDALGAHAHHRSLPPPGRESRTCARAEALRQAELALIDGPGAVDPETKTVLFSYAHPIFWAPFHAGGRRRLILVAA